MPFHNIDAFAPLYITQHVGRISEAEMTEYLTASTSLLEEHEAKDGRMISIFDTSKMSLRSPPHKRLNDEWMEANRELLARRTVATAFVVPSRILRGIMTAAFRLQRYPVEYSLHKNLAGAIDWCIRKADHVNIALPTELVDGRLATVRTHLRQ